MLFAGFAFAGQWHQTYSNPVEGAIHSISKSSSGGALYAAGDNGQIFISYDQGHYWNQNKLDVSNTFYSVSSFYDVNDIVIAVGSNGMIARNVNGSPTWTYDSMQTTVDLHTVFYDFNSSMLWAAGDSGVVLGSADGGLSWAPQNNGNIGIFTKKIDRGNYFAYLVGVKHDSSFVQRLSSGALTIAPGDTFPGIILNDLFIDKTNDDMYLAGTDVATQNAVVFKRTYNRGYGFPAMIYNAPGGIATAVGQYTVGQALAGTTGAVSQVLWFADDKGIIHETTDQAVSWHDAYQDPQNTPINAMYITQFAGPGQPLGITGGKDMNTLINNFELSYIFPNQNDVIDQFLQRVEMKFSAIPDIATIQDSVVIRSNLSGTVPYFAEYDFSDSMRVFLNLTRSIPTSGVPGEKWQVNIPETIRELHPNIVQTPVAQTVNSVFVPTNSAEMDYLLSPDQVPLQTAITNYVSGFFDSDGAPDLVACSADSILLYRTNGKGVIMSRDAIFLGFTLGLNVSKTQLLKTDLNNDGKPDLLVYDNTGIHSFINQSNTSFVFSAGPSLFINNLKQVALFDADNNAHADILVLNDSLYYRSDISVNNLGKSTVYIDYGNTTKNTLHVADINNDGRDDIYGILNDGNFYFQAYQGFGGFAPLFSTNVSTGYSRAAAIQSYSNGDHRMQVLAVSGSQVDMYEVDQNDNSRMNITPNSPITQTTPDTITDIIVQDFGANPGNATQPGQLDFILKTQSGAFKFFENSTQNGNGYTYTERTTKQVAGLSGEDYLLDWDSDENGYLDVVAYDPATGSFSNLLNQAWGPQITALFTEPAGVRIKWTGFDTARGSFDYYRVLRDSTGPEMGAAQEIAHLTNIADSTFLDTNTQPFMHYWYRVETGYNSGQVSNPSQVKDIQLITFLSGTLNGVLADTINGQYVQDSISVASGQSLDILQGVRMAFGQHAYFNVFGSLNVKGSEQQMVEFTNERHDTVNTVWDGILLAPAADTVRFKWFSIERADTALRSDGRPLFMKIGGIGHNNQGIAARGDTLHLENVAFDSNLVGLSIGVGAHALLKNILAVDNTQTGVHLEGQSTVHIRNAVMWFNGNQDLDITTEPAVTVSYSSIQKSSQPIAGTEINRNRAPIFIPNADFYNPDPYSPTVDAGDPADDFSLEPLPNGGRINQGLYGGIDLATKSDRPHVMVTPDPVNFNGVRLGNSDTLRVTIKNDGAVNATVSSIVIAKHPNIFHFLQSTPASIAAGSSVPMDLVFAPDQAITFNDTIYVDSDDPANPHLGTPVTGFGTLQNQPPAWEGPDSLNLVEDQPADHILLNHFAFDDGTASNNLIYKVVSNSDTTGILAGIQDTILSVKPAPDYFTKTDQLLVISARDQEGLISNDSIRIRVLPVQDAPRFMPFPDTTIFSNVLFEKKWPVYDVDGDTLHFSDNSTLFNIDPDSGVIKFTPQMSDTGIYQIVLSADDGHLVAQDTFAMQIKLSVIAPVANLKLTPGDKAMDVGFTMPANNLYSGTVVRYAAADTLFAPTDGLLVADSAFATGSSVNLHIKSLEIDKTYYVAVYNYFESGGIIYSDVRRASAGTLAPRSDIDTSGTEIDLPVNKSLARNILLKNTGGGTLIARFAYHPDSLTNVWFDMDTSEKTLAPGDSIQVAYNLHPNKKLPRGSKVVFVDFLSNEPSGDIAGIATKKFPIVMHPIFDDFAPHVVVTARSDSLLKETAIHFHYYLDDTTGYPIGEPDTALFAHYRLYRLNPATLIEEKDSVQANSLEFYPLEDGAYVLRIFGYDIDGNGVEGTFKKNVGFVVNNSMRHVLRNRWYMINVPRPVETQWAAFIPDSTAQIYRWKQDEERYIPIRSFPDLIYPKGMAAWVISNNAFNVDISEVPQAGLEDTLSVKISKGWNQIGAPLGYTTWWRDMRFLADGSAESLPLQQAVSQDLIDPAVYHYQDTKDEQGYRWAAIDTATAETWKGYWLYAKTAGRLFFSTHAADILPQGSDPSAMTNSILSKTGGEGGMNFSIALYRKGQADVQNQFGLGAPSRTAKIQEPPAIGGQSNLYFASTGSHLARDIEPMLDSFDDVRSWQAVVETGAFAEKHTLRWKTGMGSRQGVYLYLVDEKREKIIDMQHTDFYEFTPNSPRSRFKIYASQDADFKPVIVPASFKLQQNYPNPFNPVTHIRFGVPEKQSGQRVRLQIFNTLGQMVAELINKPMPAGYHEVTWKAINLAGRPVASGVYFYKLSSGGSVLTRKMLLLR